MQKSLLSVIFVLIMLTNFALSIVILYDRHHEGTGCFATGAGCAIVHASKYATLFGIENPWFGIVFFALWAAAFVSLLFFTDKQFRAHRTQVLRFLGVGLCGGSLYSLWMVYLQFFVIHAICVYCLWVDAIMISATLIFWFTHFPELRAALKPRV